jgi:gluconate kinase
MNKEKLLKEIKRWLKDYDDNEEHGVDLCIALKDDARELLYEALQKLSK